MARVKTDWKVGIDALPAKRSPLIGSNSGLTIKNWLENGFERF
jgi:hypothetical protein